MLLSLIALPFSILITLKHFVYFDASGIIGFDVTLIGALFLVAMQLISYVMVHTSNQGTTSMGKIIKTVLAIPGILYLVNFIYPLSFGSNLEIIIAIFLFTEGIYGLH